MTLPIEFTPEQIARIKLRYENTLTPVVEIALDEGLSETTVHRLCRRFGWVARRARGRKAVADSIVQEKAIAAAALAQGVKPLRGGDGRFARKAECAAAAPAPAVAPAGGAANAPENGGFHAPSLVRRLRIALEAELAAAQARLASEGPVAAAASARTLASLARTVTTVRTLEAEETSANRTGNTDDEPPLDLAELRRELARRIDLLRADRETS